MIAFAVGMPLGMAVTAAAMALGVPFWVGWILSAIAGVVLGRYWPKRWT